MIPGQPLDSLTGRTLLWDSSGDKEKNGVSDSGTPPGQAPGPFAQAGAGTSQKPRTDSYRGGLFFCPRRRDMPLHDRCGLARDTGIDGRCNTHADKPAKTGQRM